MPKTEAGPALHPSPALYSAPGSRHQTGAGGGGRALCPDQIPDGYSQGTTAASQLEAYESCKHFRLPETAMTIHPQPLRIRT